MWGTRVVFVLFLLSQVAISGECQEQTNLFFDFEKSKYEMVGSTNPQFAYIRGSEMSVDGANLISRNNLQSQIGQNAEFGIGQEYIASSNGGISIRRLTDHTILRTIKTGGTTAISNVDSDDFLYLSENILHRYSLSNHVDKVLFSVSNLTPEGRSLPEESDPPRLVFDKISNTVSLIVDYSSLWVISLKDGKKRFGYEAKHIYRDKTSPGFLFFLATDDHNIYSLNLASGKAEVSLTNKKRVWNFLKTGPCYFLDIDEGRDSFGAQSSRFYFYDGQQYYPMILPSLGPKLKHGILPLDIRIGLH